MIDKLLCKKDFSIYLKEGEEYEILGYYTIISYVDYLPTYYVIIKTTYINEDDNKLYSHFLSMKLDELCLNNEPDFREFKELDTQFRKYLDMIDVDTKKYIWEYFHTPSKRREIVIDELVKDEQF